MNTFMTIMAGGGGTRFWPLSRQDMPKQLLNLSGKDAMINETIKRCESLISPEHTFIVTNSRQANVMENILLSQLPRENILKEPIAKNTAPCILYAAMHIFEKHGDGVLCIFPSDHYITEDKKFLKLLQEAINIADESDRVVTIGIEPTFPSTGYGYIKRDFNQKFGKSYRIDSFIEKPNLERAKEYLNSGEYYWNSGIFIWKVSLIIDLFKRFLPRIYNNFQKMNGNFCTDKSEQLLKEIYPLLDNISVDYGIMERLDEALVIPGDFGWNDVGSWEALGAVFPTDENDNIVKADHLGVGTKECIIYGNDKLIATVGVFNMVIVDTKDALLICSKEKAQDVKFIVDKLKENNKSELL